MPKIDELVETYFKLGAKLTKMDAEYEAAIKPYKEGQDKVKGMIVEAMDEMGVENVKTAHGTPYFSHPETYKVTDPEQFIQWVIDAGAYSVLPETITRKTELRSAIADNEPPPGVEVTTIRKFCCTRK
jgi:beta-xylosidase